MFEAARLESFVKTAGGKGLHVCVPIEPELTWTQVKDFTQRIAEELARRVPDEFVATQSKSRRQGKIFVDYLRNVRGATFVAPYSTRARPNAPIAAPLEWDELGPKLRPDRSRCGTSRSGSPSATRIRSRGCRRFVSRCARYSTR
jgi:bifunctional non-homologous end joining protein LigD